MKNRKTTPSPKFSIASVMEAGKTPLLIITSMVGANFLGNMLNKAIGVDEAAEGDMLKKAIVPVAFIGAGLAGSLFLRNNNVKLICAGIAATGVYKGVKVYFQKDLMNIAGIDDLINGLRGLGEPITLAIEPYRPSLDPIDMGNVNAPYDEEVVNGGFVDAEIIN